MINVDLYINKLDVVRQWVFDGIDGLKYSLSDKLFDVQAKFDIDGMNKIKSVEKLAVIITDHAYDMGKERLSMSRVSFGKLSEKAFAFGMKHSDSAGNLKKYIDKLYLSHKVCNCIRIYGENIFFFKNNILITVYQVPNNLRKSALKIQNNLTHD